MNRSIIGYSGFIGSNLVKQTVFDDFYNSKNLAEIRNKNYNLIISAGNSAFRWKANQNPAADLSNIKNFITEIGTVRAEQFVLISTIDVYKNPIGVYEDFQPDADASNPYGQNRLYLEEFIKKRFANHLIVRLPIVYGLNFKKNILYDLLNNHEVEKIDPSAKLQFYNVDYLMADINTALQAHLSTINLATTPILISDLLTEVFKTKLSNPLGRGLVYDMRTRYANFFNRSGDYLYSRSEMITDLKNFKNKYQHET